MRSDPKRSKVKAEEMAKADTASVFEIFHLGSRALFGRCFSIW